MNSIVKKERAVETALVQNFVVHDIIKIVCTISALNNNRKGENQQKKRGISLRFTSIGTTLNGAIKKNCRNSSRLL